MRKIPEEITTKIVELYHKGYSVGKISDELSVSESTIISKLKALGEYIPGRKCLSKKESNVSIHDAEIIKMYKEGKSCQYIGEVLGLNRGSIQYRLKINNIEMREVKGIKHSIRNPTITLEFFKSLIETRKNDFDYFLGILATDGNICGNLVRIGGISDENVEFVNAWNDFLKNKLKIYRQLRKGHLKSGESVYYNTISFKNQDIVDLLSLEYGITPNKTFTLEVPYINWNFIRGAFDGDGSLTKDSRTDSWKFEIVSASEKFAYQIYDFYISEGLKAHIYKDSKNLYKINVMQIKDIIYIYNHLYKDSKYFLRRKYLKFCPVLEKFNTKHPVNSVKEMENSKTEPSLLLEEGAETRNGTPKDI